MNYELYGICVSLATFQSQLAVALDLVCLPFQAKSRCPLILWWLPRLPALLGQPCCSAIGSDSATGVLSKKLNAWLIGWRLVIKNWLLYKACC